MVCIDAMVFVLFVSFVGESLIAQNHFLANDISEKMTVLRQRANLLHETWKNRHTVYEHHLDCLSFKRDADILENWITTRYAAANLISVPELTSNMCAKLQYDFF